jgi:hypothetical protein
MNITGNGMNPHESPKKYTDRDMIEVGSIQATMFRFSDLVTVDTW